MAPLEPTWIRPSHGEIQEVFIARDGEFTSKSLSKVRLSPFAVFAKMSFPPCTMAEKATYATVQIGREKHLNLNSDLLYINHSCQPSLIFDTTNFNILAGPDGLEPGQELTFFYPSTEWHMAQPFDCLCGEMACRGRISGAKDMTRAQLEGVWLNGHIRELLDERDAAVAAKGGKSNGAGLSDGGVPNEDQTVDPTAKALRDAILQAEKVVEAAKAALRSYMSSSTSHVRDGGAEGVRSSSHNSNGAGRSSSSSSSVVELYGPATEAVGDVSGSARRGPTSRELSGEMGGDTVRS